jgi:hypothetical protein
MYTSRRGALARLRLYHRELTARYHAAIGHRDWARAQRLHGLRHRVWIAVRWHEEWGETPPPRPSGRPAMVVVAVAGDAATAPAAGVARRLH